MLHKRILLILIILLAFALRVWGLDARNIWWDEGFSAWIAQLPALQLVERTASDVHPPLYYLLLHYWQMAAGAGDFALRYLSVAAGVLGVALIYPLAAALGDRRAGVLAAFFLAISPFAVLWSQEMRMYTWAALWTTAGLWAAWRLWQTGRWRFGVAYVLAAAAALWTLYLTASLLLITNLAFLFAWRQRRWDRRLLGQWLAAQVAVAALFLPWLAFMLPRAYFGWNAAESFSPLFFLQLYATTLAAGVSENLERFLLLALAVMAILAAVSIPLWLRSRGTAQRPGLIMLLAGLILPALLVYLGALPFDLFYSVRLAPRYFFPLAICFYSLLALGLAAQAERRRWLALAATGLVTVTALLGLVSVQSGHIRRDLYDSLVSTLQTYQRPADAVVLHSDKDWPIFAAQFRGSWTGVPNAWRVEEADAAALLDPIWQGADGVWVITTPDAVQTDPQAYVRRWLAERATAITSWDFGENALSFYAKTPQRIEQASALRPDFELPHQATTLADGPLAAAWLPLTRYPVGDTVHLALFWRQPPSGDVRVMLRGPVSREVDVPIAALPEGPSRQQVDLPLTPDLPPGRYTVDVRAGVGEAVEVGRFTLAPLGPVGQASLNPAATPLAARWGPSIRLLGYELAQDAVQPGGSVDLTLYWQTQEPVTARYKVFTHLLGEVWNADNGNFIWGQADSEPVDGQAPTTTWAPGAIIVDRYAIPVAAAAPSGLYRLEVGLYGLVDGVRLPLFDAADQPQGDAILLGTIRVE